MEPLRDDQGQIIGCIGVGLDITERKEAANTLHQYTMRLETLRQFSNRVGLDVIVQCAEPVTRLPSEVKTGLFCITQEALMNVTKHAHTSISMLNAVV